MVSEVRTVLGVRPNVHLFGYAFVRFPKRGGEVVLEAGLLRARAKWGQAGQAESQVKQGRDLAGLLRIVAQREDIVAICAPTLTTGGRSKEELADDSRAWGQVDLLAEVLRVPVVVVASDYIEECMPVLIERHRAGAWLAQEEFSGIRKRELVRHTWSAVGAAIAAASSGRLQEAIGRQVA
jgi:hypothetical protein